MSFVVGPLLGDLQDPHDLIPDGPSLIAAVIMGWLPAGILGAIAMVLARLLGGRIASPLAPAPKSDDLG
jgi:hypothetical protein